MRTEVTLESTANGQNNASGAHDGAIGRGTLLLAVSVLLFALASWVVVHQPYEPTSGFGYALGILGGTAMLILLLYPLRKHMRIARGLGPLRYWFRLHMFCGLFGPAMVVFHTAFHVGSINAAVALSCMLLVAASGIVGRFLYRRIHHGLYGSRTTLKETRQGLEELLAKLGPQIERVPELQYGLETFTGRAANKTGRRSERALEFLLLGWRRRQAVNAVKRALRRPNFTIETTNSSDHLPGTEDLVSLIKAVDKAFYGIHRTAQFSTYERLFSLWHVAHVPFVYLFVVTAVIHVVAVHVY